MGRNSLIDLEVFVHHETEKAFLVSTDGEKDNAIWVPKSQSEIVFEDTSRQGGTLTMHEWMAVDKGLI